MAKKLLSLAIIAILLFPSIKGNIDDEINHVAIKEKQKHEIIKNISSTQEIDQRQEKQDGYVRIYQQYCYAQSFKPSMCGLDGIDLLIARHGIALNGIFRIFSKLFGSFFLGNLEVGIYKNLEDVKEGKPLCNKTISAGEISRSPTWIHIDLSKNLKWNRTYYIVVWQDGGSDRQYYKWYYGTGNPYDRGSSYDGNSLIWNWSENASRDFCFKTYAHKTGDEADGIVERWAVLIGELVIIQTIL